MEFRKSPLLLVLGAILELAILVLVGIMLGFAIDCGVDGQWPAMWAWVSRGTVGLAFGALIAWAITLAYKQHVSVEGVRVLRFTGRGELIPWDRIDRITEEPGTLSMWSAQRRVVRIGLGIYRDPAAVRSFIRERASVPAIGGASSASDA